MEAYIKKHGVTECPGALTPELAAHHKRKAEEWLTMTPNDRRRAAGWRGRRRNHQIKEMP